MQLLKPGEKVLRTRHCNQKRNDARNMDGVTGLKSGREGHELQVGLLATQCTLRLQIRFPSLDLCEWRREVMAEQVHWWAASVSEWRTKTISTASWLSSICSQSIGLDVRRDLLQLFGGVQKTIMKASSWEEMSISAWWETCYCKSQFLKYIWSSYTRAIT